MRLRVRYKPSQLASGQTQTRLNRSPPPLLRHVVAPQAGSSSRATLSAPARCNTVPPFEMFAAREHRSLFPCPSLVRWTKEKALQTTRDFSREITHGLFQPGRV